ncbi:MAG: sigma-70 family RNA polymerase sigma factor [Oscillospiraceae bacterium]|nr:sigma-70 family RNA polymerase sigma factor [Oscillospiraceae bacterium]
MEDINNISEVNNNFYEKYNLQIRGIVARILNNANQAQDIDDCVNTVFLTLMERLEQYNETRGSLAAFVAIVARSVALNHRKGNICKTSELVGDEKIDYIIEPLEVEDKIEFQMLVDMILEKLNEQESILFAMKYIYFYPPDEIAKTFKINRNAVDGRVNRLKNKIKKLLIKGGITL